MRDINICQGESFSLNEEESLEYIKDILDSKNIKTQNVFYENGLVFFPSSLVGTIKMPEAEITISPRHEGISLNHVIRLYNFTYFGSEDINFSKSLFDLDESANYNKIIDTFIEELLFISKKGIDSDFTWRQNCLKNKKGKLNIDKTYNNLKIGKNYPLVCNYTEVGYDTNLNIYISLALEKVKSAIEFDDYVYLKNKFPYGKRNISSFQRNKIRINRKNAYYLKAYQFASLILNETFFESRGQSEEYNSFLVNYDKLFEDFIKLILINRNQNPDFFEWNNNQVYGVYIKNGAEYPKYYKPDILYKKLSNENCFAVIDVKNKTSSPFNNQDIFQILFYLNMLDSKKALLIYPSDKKDNLIKLKLNKKFNETYLIYAIFVEITAVNTTDFLNSIYEFQRNVLKVIQS